MRAKILGGLMLLGASHAAPASAETPSWIAKVAVALKSFVSDYSGVKQDFEQKTTINVQLGRCSDSNGGLTCFQAPRYYGTGATGYDLAIQNLLTPQQLGGQLGPTPAFNLTGRGADASVIYNSQASALVGLPGNGTVAGFVYLGANERFSQDYPIFGGQSHEININASVQNTTFNISKVGNSYFADASGAPIGQLSYNDIGTMQQGGGYFNRSVSATYDITGIEFLRSGVDASPPTVAQLAALSANVYRESLYSAGPFRSVAQLGDFANFGANGYYAEAFLSPGQDGGSSQIVVAIRGTDRAYDYIKDGSFVGVGSAEAGRKTVAQLSAEKLADQITTLKLAYPDAKFTFTGHSLGGAIAEALGQAADVAAVSFNAPGGQNALSPALLRGRLLANGELATESKGVTAYRNYGDVISQVGEHFGVVKTIISSADQRQQLDNSLYGSCFIACHAISSVVKDLSSSTSTILAGSLSPPVTSGINFVVSETGNYLTNVSRGSLWFFDPIAEDSGLLIDMSGSTARLSGIFAPAVGSFDIYGFNEGGWSSLQTGKGLIEVPVADYQKYLISGLSQLADQNGDYMIGLRFANDGVFSGNIRSSSIGLASGVPEPSNWALMILGFSVMGVALRRPGRDRVVLSAAPNIARLETSASQFAQAPGRQQGGAADQ